MSDALKVSSDVFFYKLGEQADSKGPVDPEAGEAARLRPHDRDRHRRRGARPGARQHVAQQGASPKYSACAKKNHVEERTGDALYKCGGVERTWTTGDNVNLAVGQGDLQATPLQVAVAYSALANGGTIVKPHLGQAIEDGNGVTVQELPVKPGKKIKIDPQDRAVVLDGLHRAATEDGGTSADVFKGFPKTYTQLYGKTGTVERQPNPDQAWYACFVKDGGKPIVVVVTVERGGFGAETAAPAARLILSQWFDVKRPRVQNRLRPEQLSAQSIQPASEPPPPLVPRELAPAPGSAAAARDARPGRLLADRHQGRDGGRHPWRPAVLRQTPSDLRHRRARPDVRRLASGLLAPARVALSDLRRADGLDHRRARSGRGHARRQVAGSRFPASTCSLPSSARSCWSSPSRASWSSGCARWAARPLPG